MSSIKSPAALNGRSAVNGTNLERASSQIDKAVAGRAKLTDAQLTGLVKFLDKALPKLSERGHGGITSDVNYVEAVQLKNNAVTLLNSIGDANGAKGGERTKGGERSVHTRADPQPKPTHTHGGERTKGGERKV